MINEIIDGPIPESWLTGAQMLAPEYGAVSSFLGVGRNHHHGKGVTHLEYECYKDMALKLMPQLADLAEKKVGEKIEVRIAHGTGRIEPGETVLAIHVSSAHRDAAFTACRFLIEEIKKDLPVWKKEFYTDGTHAWLKGS